MWYVFFFFTVGFPRRSGSPRPSAHTIRSSRGRFLPPQAACSATASARPIGPFDHAGTCQRGRRNQWNECGEERIEELPAELGLVVLDGLVRVAVAVEPLHQIEEFLGRGHFLPVDGNVGAFGGKRA